MTDRPSLENTIQDLPYATRTERGHHTSLPDVANQMKDGSDASHPADDAAGQDGCGQDEMYETKSNSGSEESSKSKGIPPLASHEAVPAQFKSIFTLRRRKATGFDLDAVATQPSVYDDPEVAKHHAPHEKWENKHRFDPSFRWTWREQKAVTRKLDRRILVAAFLFFFCLDLDRENITAANSDNLLGDLGMTTNDYNLGNTLFKVGFLIAELPSQMISKRIGADIWIPAQLVLWSIASAAQFWMNDRATFLALRYIIGTCEGGFIADMVLWLSYFYPKAELPIRLAFFWTSNYLVKIVSPFLAIGLLQLRGHNGRSGWRYLFLIEGIFTMIVGIGAFFHMPASPTQSKNILYRNGWFTEHEEKIIVNRIIRDDPSKGDMHNRQGVDLRGFMKTLGDYDMWPLFAVGLVYMIPTYPIKNYLTLQLKHLGFSVEETNALTVPAPVMGLVLLVVVAVVSETVDNRSFVAMSMSVWHFISFVALYAIPVGGSPWIYWAVATIEQSAPYTHPVVVAWVSRQSGSVRTRTISAAIFNMNVQASSIIGANVFQASDAPGYKKGSLAMVILSACNCVFFVLIFFYYSWRNKTRERKWNAMSKAEQLHYLETTKDEGNRRLDWRFAT